MRRRATQAPTAQVVFGNIDCRHRPNHQVVQRNRNGSGDLVAPTNPCHGDRQQRLEGIQGGEAEKNSDSRT
jgi:hypothetical protein